MSKSTCSGANFFCSHSTRTVDCTSDSSLSQDIKTFNNAKLYREGNNFKISNTRRGGGGQKINLLRTPRYLIKKTIFSTRQRLEYYFEVMISRKNPRILLEKVIKVMLTIGLVIRLKTKSRLLTSLS